MPSAKTDHQWSLSITEYSAALPASQTNYQWSLPIAGNSQSLPSAQADHQRCLQAAAIGSANSSLLSSETDDQWRVQTASDC
jgi:hypothetical protein